jgi:localization factor PodJL
MNSGFPWQIDGVDRRARDTAQEAARRAGMSVGEWLDTIILNSARPAEAMTRGRDSERRFTAPGTGTPSDADRPPNGQMAASVGDDRRSQGGQTPERGNTILDLPHATNSTGEDTFLRAAELVERLSQARAAERYRPAVDEGFARIHDRLDGLTHRLGALLAQQSTSTGLMREPRPEAPPEVAHVIANIDRRLDQLMASGRAEFDRHPDPVDDTSVGPEPYGTPLNPPAANSLDQALLEIADRQRALDAGIATDSTPRSSHELPGSLPRARTQDLTELEQQLRQINIQLEELKQPCTIDKAVDTLRDDLAEIGVMLQEAMPRKAVEALETEIRSLAGRIDQTREAGADGAVLAGVERTLSDMRDALRNLMPAEGLVGVNQAVADLSRKIDLIGTNARDPMALEQLEEAIVAMRGIASQVASNDALTRLTGEVRALSEKVDQVTTSSSSAVLAALEGRIATLADALEAHNHRDHGVPRHADLAGDGAVDKFEESQLKRSDHTALGHLEDRIAKLVEKLDASDGRLQHLEAIEHGLAELLIHLERYRTADHAASQMAAPPEVAAIVRDVADLRQSEQQTQDALEAVHGTLGHVVDRLAMIEGSLREPAAPSAASSPSQEAWQPTWPLRQSGTANASVDVTSAAPRSSDVVSSPSLSPTADRVNESVLRSAPTTTSPPAERRAIDPNLPPDHPLEPRTGAARGRAANSPADRIAASEAALAGTKPPVAPDSAGSSNFIAAARRAAQAAGRDNVAKKQAGVPKDSPDAATKLTSRLGRLRALLTGAAAFVIVLGTVQIVRNFLDTPSEPEVSAPSVTQTSPPPSPAPVSEPAPQPPAPANPVPSTSPPSTGRESSLQPAVDGATGTAAPAAAPVVPQSKPEPPKPPVPPNEITGTIQRWSGLANLPSTPKAAPPPVTTPPAIAPETIPAAFGTALRAAASKGDPAAQYEVAIRFADGRGVTQNMTEAAGWFERAAKQGLAPAQFRLGGLYEKGLGVKKDLEAARHLYLAAGEAGNGKALHNLAVLYAEGFDGKPDYQVAAKWFRKAADFGIADSQYNLAILYGRGIGLEQNLIEAYKWFALAARDGDAEAAKKRDEIGARLDQQALAAASRAVQAWQAQPQPDAAIEVKTPAGGWEGMAAAPSPAAPSSRRKPQPPTPVPTLELSPSRTTR